MKKVFVTVSFLLIPIASHAISDVELARYMGQCFAHTSYVGVLLAKSNSDPSKFLAYAKKAERIGTQLSQAEFKKVALSDMNTLKNYDVEKYMATDSFKRLLSACAELINSQP